MTGFLKLMESADRYIPNLPLRSDVRQKVFLFNWENITESHKTLFLNKIRLYESKYPFIAELLEMPINKQNFNMVEISNSEHQILLVLNYEMNKVKLSIDGQYVSEYKVSAYHGNLTVYEYSIKNPSLSQRITRTIIGVSIFYILSIIPRLGNPNTIIDPLESMGFPRLLFASTYGSLLELGTGPLLIAIITTNFIFGILFLKNRVNLLDKNQRQKYNNSINGALKLLALFLTILQGWIVLVYLGCGEELTGGWFFVLILQFILVSFALLWLSQYLRQGIFGSEDSNNVFVTMHISFLLIWILLNPFSNTEFPGVIPTLFEKLLTNQPFELFGNNSISGLYEIVWLFGLIPFFILLLRSKIEIPIVSTKYRGFSAVYPLDFFYITLIPAAVSSIILSMIKFSHVIFLFDFEIIVKSILEPCNVQDFLPVIEPSKIFKSLSPPTIDTFLHEPLDGIIFVGSFFAICLVYSLLYLESINKSPKGAARDILKADVNVPGFRRSNKPVETLLNKYIPMLTVLSVLIITIIITVSSIFGLMTKTIAMFVAVGVFLAIYDQLKRGKIEEVMPKLAKILGFSKNKKSFNESV